jgi:hypothetical protein
MADTEIMADTENYAQLGFGKQGGWQKHTEMRATQKKMLT